MSRLDAVDVARYQLDVDWTTVHANTAGTIACFKATQGTTYVDPKFERNRVGTENAGFTHRLMYHWLSPDKPVVVQVQHLLRTVGPLGPGEGIMLDVEEQGVTLGMALDAATRIELVTGRPVCIYTGAFVAGGTIWRSDVLFNGTRPRLLAAYTSEAKARYIAWPHWADMWQWTSTATVPGVPTRVDGNRIDNLAAFDPVCGHIQEGPDMEYVILDVEDSNVLLIAKRDRTGLILEAEWTGPGSDPKVQARLAWLRAKNTETVPFPVASLAYVTLVGPVPHGDPARDWHEAMFFRVVD